MSSRAARAGSAGWRWRGTSAVLASARAPLGGRRRPARRRRRRAAAAIPTRRPSRRASTRPRRTSAIRSASASSRSAKRGVAGEPAGHASSSARSRCWTATRRRAGPGRRARCRREFALVVAAYEPGEVEIPADRGHLPRPDAARCRPRAPAPSPIKIASLIANEPEPALKDAAAAGVGDGGEPRSALRRRRRCWRRALGALITFFDRRAGCARAPRRASRRRRRGPRTRSRSSASIAWAPRLPRERRRPALLLRGVGGDPRLPGRALRLRLARADHRRADRRAAAPRGARAGRLHARRDPGLAVGAATW